MLTKILVKKKDKILPKQGRVKFVLFRKKPRLQRSQLKPAVLLWQ